MRSASSAITAFVDLEFKELSADRYLSALSAYHLPERASLYLFQILLPLFDNEGRPLPEEAFRKARDELTARYGGLTAFTRAPAHGEWNDAGERHRDDIVVFEVMVDDLELAWWRDYRRGLEISFRQKQIVIRSLAIRLL
jgi:hypothetical protein